MIQSVYANSSIINMVSKLTFIFLILSVNTWSQSMSWQTTRDGQASGNCRLESNSISINVNNFHINVIEEAVITAEGPLWRGDPNSLEIIGEFSLVPGSAIRSMLLWNGDQILKAKLKNKDLAESEYEEVVDRQKEIIRPRDPALIEYLGNNRYSYKIYPVALNESRKIRILYTIPMESNYNSPSFTLKTAFTVGAAYTPAQIPVTIKKNNQSVGNFDLKYLDQQRPCTFGASYLLPQKAFRSGNYYDNKLRRWVTNTAAIRLLPQKKYNDAYTYSIDSGNASGEYAAVFSVVPGMLFNLMEMDAEEVLDKYSIDAVVKAGDKTFISNLQRGGCLGIYMKTREPWDGIIDWQVYDKRGVLQTSYREKMEVKANWVGEKWLPLIWGAQYTLKENSGNLGAVYGFVDEDMSLLALESDILPDDLAEKFAESGMPALSDEEIFVNSNDIPKVPLNSAIFEFTSTAHADITGVNMTVKVMAGGWIALNFTGDVYEPVDITMVGIDGRIIKHWRGLDIQDGSVRFQIPEGLKGAYILRIKSGKTMIQRRIRF